MLLLIKLVYMIIYVDMNCRVAFYQGSRINLYSEQFRVIVFLIQIKPERVGSRWVHPAGVAHPNEVRGAEGLTNLVHIKPERVGHRSTRSDLITQKFHNL
jgi:hypothetical protein